MAIQNFSYTKVSELPLVNQISNDDVIIINHNGVTSKMTYSQFKELIQSSIDSEITALTTRVTTLENSTSSLATRVTESEGTINNIITAGFNLIGVDTNA